MKTTLRTFFIIMVTIGIPALSAADPLHTIEMDERMFGFRLHENGSGFEATLRHERRDYDFSGELRKAFPMRDAFRTLARSNDGRVLIHNTQSRGLDIVIWDIEQEKEIKRVACDHSPRNCWFSPDGRWLVVTTRHKVNDNPIERTRLYDAANTYKPWDFGDAMIGVSFSPDGGRLATLDGTNQVQIWNVQSHEPVAQFKIAKGRILACGIQFSSDSKQICVGYNEDTMRRGLWDWAGRVKFFAID